MAVGALPACVEPGAGLPSILGGLTGGPGLCLQVRDASAGRCPGLTCMLLRRCNRAACAGRGPRAIVAPKEEKLH